MPYNQSGLLLIVGFLASATNNTMASILQENRQSGSSSRWNPIAALRSFRQPPTAKVGADSKLTAEELEVEDALANYLRASRAQQGQQAQHRRPRHHQ